MKTTEELNTLKEKFDTADKPSKLTEEELAQVTGGQSMGSPRKINPDDTETINVLKDASATAIYGIRGANGVILVTK